MLATRTDRSRSRRKASGTAHGTVVASGRVMTSHSSEFQAGSLGREASVGASKSSTPERSNVRAFQEFDVVVVGGGGSGLAAAIEAASLGRSVCLIEKAERLGGTTGRSVGSIAASNTPHQRSKGIKDSPADHFDDFRQFNATLNLPQNETLARMLVENVPETMRWLMSMGIEFYGPMNELPHRKPRMHNVLPDSRAYIFHLERAARRLGVTVMTAAPARELVQTDGRVTGVVVDAREGAVELRARGAVVLACGDYSASRELRARHISKAIASVSPVNPHNTGDGHSMVRALGGRIINGHLHLAGIRFQAPPPKLIGKIPPYPIVTRFMRWALDNLPGAILRPFVISFLTTILVPSPKLFKNGAILINKNGERFTDELSDPVEDMARQPDQLAYIVLDGKLVEKFTGWPYYVSTAPGVAYASISDYRRTRKDIFREAATLPELAAKLGVPAAALEASVTEHNAKLGRPRSAEDERKPLDRGPYVALGPVRYWVNFTDGGIAVDDRLRVLGEDDVPLEGLYAAGLTGMGGVLLEGHGHHLGWAFTSGRIAGRHAAYEVVSADLPEAAQY